MSHGGFVFSCHLSGMMNGFTHVMPPAGAASAVAVAAMSIVDMPSSDPRRVVTGLLRPAVRYTLTFTRFDPVGPAANVTRAGSTATAPFITVFCCEPLMAL